MVFASTSKDGGPLLYSTRRATEYLGISAFTLRRYCKILGIRPRKLYRMRGRYYLYPDLIRILRLHAPEVGNYRARVMDRYEVMREKGLDKDIGESDEV